VHASRTCSGVWEENTITLTSPDGTEQTVDILCKDALSAAQNWLLTHEYDMETDINEKAKLSRQGAGGRRAGAFGPGSAKPGP
jgi:hypothetical protein